MLCHDLHSCDREEELGELLFPFINTSSVNSPTDFLHDFAVFQTQCPTPDSVWGGHGICYSSFPTCSQIEDLSVHPSGMNRGRPLLVSHIGDRDIGSLGTIKKEGSDPNWDYCDEAFGSHSCFSPDELNCYMMQRDDGITTNGRRGSGNLCTLSEGWVESLGGGLDGFFHRQIRRACSTGDFLGMRGRVWSPQGFSSPTAEETWLVTQEPNVKAVRCTGEERKEKILRYRAKRTQRNFNKTIKYECRKALADNRLRVRGRFARNDEAGIPGMATFLAKHHEGKDDYLWG